MAQLNLLSLIGHKLTTDIFSQEQINEIVLRATAIKRNTSDDLISFVAECFSAVTSGDTAFKKNILVQLMQDVAKDPTSVCYLRVSQGAQFCVEFTLNVGEDFTGSFLTARNAEDDTLLSPNNIAGDSQVNDPVQEVEITDLSLTADDFYHVDYLTEGDTAGAANGEAGTLLDKYYFYVTRNIDSA